MTLVNLSEEPYSKLSVMGVQFISLAGHFVPLFVSRGHISVKKAKT